MRGPAFGGSWYVGLACDRNYVEHTAVTLTSIDMNGGVPEARVLIAAFGLTPDDRVTIRAGAGRLAPRLRFVDISAEMVDRIHTDGWETSYPLAVLGRLFLPYMIEQPGARLMTIDSDTIVNTSVRPLMELDFRGDYIAACHDVPRTNDPDYFNSGLMIIDVDRYLHYDVGKRSLQWLQEQETPPKWPDQDALNEIVGYKWVRLNYKWNLHCIPFHENRGIESQDFENAYIAHFAAAKPWITAGHPGLGLYHRYHAEALRRKALWDALIDRVDGAFVVLAHEVLLGTEPDAGDVETFQGLSASEILHWIANSDAFAATTLLSLKLGVEPPGGQHQGLPEMRHRVWACERLPVSLATEQRVWSATTWREFLEALVEDEDVQALLGLRHLTMVIDRAAGHPSMGAKPEHAAAG